MVRHPSLSIPPGETLLDVLRWRAEHQPEQPAYVFLRDGISPDTVLTYRQLDARARSIAGDLQSRFAPGDRLLLVYPPGLEFVQAFWGALYAGLVAVPVPPPDAYRAKVGVARVQRLAEDAGAAGALSTNQILELVRAQGTTIPLEQWVICDASRPDSTAQWRSIHPLPSTLAYLQYTSGSTSAPKGVMVSHGNMTAQSRCITEAGRYDADSVTLSWMPHFHDYGLVKGIVQPAWIGRPAYLMSPLTFLKRPLRWLEAIQRYHVTHSGAPNFAYRRCVETIAAEDRARLDLSGWQVASCGAEPIAHDTIDRFAEAFAPAGFRREAFFPAYGMAEYTLLISLKRESVAPTVLSLDPATLERGVVSEAKAGIAPVRQVVGCGAPVGDTRVVIAHPETLSRCAVQQVGEIWLAGASTTQGYWNNPEETARTFGATLRDTGEGPFLRTGDLGFVRDGEVFVTGRLKDLLIVRGRNHYPQDIERTVEQSHRLFRGGGAGAFSVQDAGEEVVVVVQEVERQATALAVDDLAAAIRSAVSEQHDLHVSSVIFIKAGSLPKTSSGKLQRRACRDQFLTGQLSIIGKSVLPAPLSQAQATVVNLEDLRALSSDARRRQIEQDVQGMIADRLGCSREAIVHDRPIHLLGLDSLMTAEVSHRVEESFQVPLSLQHLLGGATLGDLAATIEAGILREGSELTAAGGQNLTAENVAPLSENQAALWFLSQLAPDSAAANVSVILPLPFNVDQAVLEQALDRLGERHATLRTTYETQDEVPVQRIHARLPLIWTVIDASTWDWARSRREAMEAAASPFNLAHGPLWRASLFKGKQQAWLLLVAHHIAVDGWSMIHLVEDLKRNYASDGFMPQDGPNGLGSQPAPYGAFIGWHRALMESAEGGRLAQYWKARLAGELPNYDMLYDRQQTTVAPGRYAWQAIHIDRALTERLKAFAQAEGTTLYAVCLTALHALLYRYTNVEDTAVVTPVFGRSRSRFARTVGDFVNMLVLRETVQVDSTGRELLALTKRTLLEALDHQDYPYARLVSDLRPARDRQRAPLGQILFVLQQFRLLSELDGRMSGSSSSVSESCLPAWEAYVIPQQSGQFDLCLELAESEQGLTGYFEYKDDLFTPDRMARMQQHFLRVLEGLVADPAAQIGSLPLMSEAECRETVLTWGQSPELQAPAQCLHRQIEAQVLRTPDAIAVRQGDQELTYRELNARANRVAHYLRRRGVAPGVVVGLCLE
ncbi:MAG: condensation domain-containing protein, partial [Nitrospira sp.]